MANNHITIRVYTDPLIEPLLQRAEQDIVLALTVMNAIATNTALVHQRTQQGLSLHLSDRLMAAYYESLGS